MHENYWKGISDNLNYRASEDKMFFILAER